MSAEVRRHDLQNSFGAHGFKQAGFCFEIEPVTALGFDGGGAVFKKAFRKLNAKSCGVFDGLDGGMDATTPRQDFSV